jgi:hypothetical protein
MVNLDNELIMFKGAQSDSELPSASASDNFSDRGYTSDSEVSYDRQAAANRCPSPLEIRPIHENGSWLLVEFYHIYILDAFFVDIFSYCFIVKCEHMCSFTSGNFISS